MLAVGVFASQDNAPTALNNLFTTSHHNLCGWKGERMRKIEIIDDVRMRFPGRETEFNVGFEVGVISVLIAQGAPIIERQVSKDALEQLRPIAERFRYIVSAREDEDGLMSVCLARWPKRPHLRVVEC